MRRIFVALFASLAVASLTACGGDAPQCGTVEQISTVPAMLGQPEPPAGSLKPGQAMARTDLYTVEVQLAEEVSQPSLVSVTDQLNLGWPGNETSVAVNVPAGDFLLVGSIGNKDCSTKFTVEASS